MSPDHLHAILIAYPTRVRPLDRPEPLGNAGGFSGSRLWRFVSGLGPMLAREWPEDGPDRAALERIHGWVGTASALEFLPVPVPGLDGKTIQVHDGRCWSVEPWRPGRADLDRPPAPSRLRAGFAALAAFHQRLPRDRVRAPSPGLRARLAEVEGLMGGEFTRLKSAVLQSQARGEPEVGPALAWLGLVSQVAPRLVVPLRRAATVAVGLQPVLRDVRPDHLLFEGERVSGLVDFGAMAVDTVAADLGRLLSEWIDDDPAARAEALAAYTAVRPLDDAETALIPAFEDSAALLGAGRWVRWHFLEGRRFEDPSAVPRGIQKGFDRLVRLAARPFTR